MTYNNCTDTYVVFIQKEMRKTNNSSMNQKEVKTTNNSNEGNLSMNHPGLKHFLHLLHDLKTIELDLFAIQVMVNYKKPVFSKHTLVVQVVQPYMSWGIAVIAKYILVDRLTNSGTASKNI